MADVPHIPDENKTSAKLGTFAWTKGISNATAIIGAIDVVFRECDR
jgi:hypothetical protein